MKPQVQYTLAFISLIILTNAEPPFPPCPHGPVGISQACLLRQGWPIDIALLKKELLLLDEEVQKLRATVSACSPRAPAALPVASKDAMQTVPARVAKRSSSHRLWRPRLCLVAFLALLAAVPRRPRRPRQRLRRYAICHGASLPCLPCFQPDFCQKLGEGGFAEVWAGHFGTQRVAIKLMKLEWASKAEAERLWKEEVRMMRLCRHPQVVAFFGEVERCIPLELMAGYNCLLSPAVLTTAALEVLQALAHLHGLGVAHRDIKPQNILVSSRDPPFQCKLADLGLATVVPQQQLRQPVGTAEFMAPEIFLRRYGVKADL